MTLHDDIKEALRPMANQIKSHIPEGCGYAIFLFHFLKKGNTLYLSNAQRQDMLKMTQEYIDHIERDPIATNLMTRVRVDDQTFESRAFREAMQQPFKRINRIVRLQCPEGTEYCLLVFNWEAGGNLTYISSVHVDEMLRLVREWLAHAKKAPGAKWPSA